MSRLRAFRATLQSRVRPDDSLWSYNVEGLPSSTKTNQARVIKVVSVVASAKRQFIELRLEDAPSNRITMSESLDKMLLISMSDFRLQLPAETLGEDTRSATARQSADYITRLLATGLVLNGTRYNFFGHSNSQLKSRSCFMYAASKEAIHRRIEAMGDFSKLKSAGKKAKRIGLLFSSADMALTVDPDRCQDIEDVKKDDYIFTDGCGLISAQFARQLVQRRNINYRNKKYLPSVFQIRYRGYKGVLALDPPMKGKTVVKFRESMRKFKDAKDLSFAVVAFSKPYTFGYLNNEVVLLLHALGVPADALLQRQTEHIQFLGRVAHGDPRAAFQFLSYCDRLDVAERLLIDGIESVLPTLQSLVKQEHVKMMNKYDEQRCRIMIPRSRLLFGICDPTAQNGSKGRLRGGQCFVRITNDEDGLPRTIINAPGLVTRNPCLHPGDLQKFQTVDIPEFAHLVDCIVFPTVGRRPSADLMSGGDLDGDKFFVTWDPDIIPRTLSQPAEYPGVKEPVNFGEVTGDVRAEYFARYTNASLGRVKNLYIKWARLKGALSTECQELNRLFSQCVDGNRIKIPQRLEDPKERRESDGPFILDALHECASKTIGSLDTHGLNSSLPLDLTELLLSRDSLAMSEFELVQMTLQWCERNEESFMQFVDFFNFNALTDEQQAFLINSAPPTTFFPGLIRNGLLQSNLADSAELRRFRLDHPGLHWKRVFDSSTDRMGRFNSAMCRSLELFHKKLVIIRLDDRLTIAIYIPQKIERASEVRVGPSVRVFALPRSQDRSSAAYRVMPTKVNYQLYCDDSSFQLYDDKRGNTWIFITRGPPNESTYRNINNRGDRNRAKQETIDNGINFDCRTSIALDKIGKDVQKHVGRVNRAGILAAEIYTISNRDVHSMQVLDQWLHYVDTEEIVPLFQDLELEYDAPSVVDINWEDLPVELVAVIRDRKLSRLQHIQSLGQIMDLMHLLSDHEEKMLLREVVTELLSRDQSGDSAFDRPGLASSILDFLPSAVHLVPLLFKSELWSLYKDQLQDVLASNVHLLLTEVVLAGSSYPEFVRRLFETTLHEVKHMSFQSFVELVELIALTSRTPDSALNLLLECLEPEANRILVGRPLAIQHSVKEVIGVALSHVDEATEDKRRADGSIMLKFDKQSDGFEAVKSHVRIDSSISGLIKTGDHVRLTASTPPQNKPVEAPYSIDAVVLSSETGLIRFRCLHRPPNYLEECAWTMKCCGSFVTAKTALDAVRKFYTDREMCCRLYQALVGVPETGTDMETEDPTEGCATQQNLNESQTRALQAATSHPFVLLWGPPGTGKTYTIVAILKQLLRAQPKKRLLVTAPTHNAVDNMLRKFIDERGVTQTQVTPIRVSTSLAKVASDLKSYTCDAMVGKDLTANHAARRKAQKQIKESRLVFTTCVSAGLGLLRDELFEIVIVDEASQQTEPETLIPLVKGCEKAILVGDHVQLRATVGKHAPVVGLDVSLFERHYSLPERAGVRKVMLDTQYRMHQGICQFSSVEFYGEKLRTAVADTARPLPSSKFPWPEEERMVFVNCSAPEDLGRQSKSNEGQAEVCKRVCELLTTWSDPPDGNHVADKAASEKPDIAILTPYTRQRELLSSMIPRYPAHSIDGYQGREADIIIFVTVRSNVHSEIGFLTDMRRLNVAMTRARSGVVVIGDRATLTRESDAEGGSESKRVWKRLVDGCVEVKLCNSRL